MSSLTSLGRFGENVYTFFRRCFLGELASSWRLEVTRTEGQWWRNEVVRSAALSATVVCILYGLFDRGAVGIL